MIYARKILSILIAVVIAWFFSTITYAADVDYFEDSFEAPVYDVNLPPSPLKWSLYRPGAEQVMLVKNGPLTAPDGNQYVSIGQYASLGMIARTNTGPYLSVTSEAWFNWASINGDGELSFWSNYSDIWAKLGFWSSGTSVYSVVLLCNNLSSITLLTGQSADGWHLWQLKGTITDPNTGAGTVSVLRDGVPILTDYAITPYSADAKTIDYVEMNNRGGQLDGFKAWFHQTVPPWPYQCGDKRTSYYSTDLNKDCYVNLKDFAQFANEWLQCTDPNNNDCNTP